MNRVDRLNFLLLLIWVGLGCFWLWRFNEPGGNTSGNLMLLVVAGLMMIWNLLQIWRRRVVRAPDWASPPPRQRPAREGKDRSPVPPGDAGPHG
ncbi:MAG TPA: hypothetical protein PKC45_09875 [Gemmatales bacterium]|nr:hypothetical protein [Gemmatales bacterium]